MTYLVKFQAYSREFNEHYVANQVTRNLEKFCKTHKVVEAYECKVGRYGQVAEIGRKVM